MADSNNFAALKGARKCWAVAAIHGDAERLKTVHGLLAERLQPGDNLVYLGNMVGIGAAARATLGELLAFRRWFLAKPGVFLPDIVYLRGSQEEMWQKLLQIHLALNPGEVLKWMFDHGVGATLESFGGRPAESLAAAREGARSLNRWAASMRDALRTEPGHNALMSTLKQAAYTDDNGLLFVHAGIDTSRPLEEQGDRFWWGGHGFAALATPYAGFQRIVRGYDRDHKGIQVGAYSTTLDGGCGFGGPLVAGCFAADGELVEEIEV